MKCAWLGGWALPLAWQESVVRKHYPEAEHFVCYPGANWDKHFAWDADVFGAYSLGVRLLLSHPSIVPYLRTKRVHCFAPVWDIRLEYKRGGKVETGKLKYLKRWLRKDPLAAIGDFYKRSGIGIPPPVETPYPYDDIQWGIDQLLEGPSEDSCPFSERVSFYLGDKDLLIGSIGEESVSVVSVLGAGHSLDELLSSKTAPVL